MPVAVADEALEFEHWRLSRGRMICCVLMPLALGRQFSSVHER